MKEMKTATVWTWGIIVETDENTIKVTSSVAELNNDVSFGHDTIIPKGAVEEIRILRKQWWR